MAKKKPESGLTSDELTEVTTMEASVVREEAREAASPLAAPVLSPADEIACLEAEIVKAQARIFELQHPPVPFPKMVKGRTFATQAELDAAGKEFA